MAIVIAPPLSAALLIFVLIVKVPFWISISPPAKLTASPVVLITGLAPENIISLSLVSVPPAVVTVKLPPVL